MQRRHLPSITAGRDAHRLVRERIIAFEVRRLEQRQALERSRLITASRAYRSA
jgi:hypothetical protein